MKQLQEELFKTLTSTAKEAQAIDTNEIPATVNAAIYATYKSNESAIEDVCHYIENNLSDIIQLPELFFMSDKSLLHDDSELTALTDLSSMVVNQISNVLRPFQYVCTSLIIDGQHQAVIIGDKGIFAKQAQLLYCQRYHWTTLGESLNVVELPLEQGRIKLAMFTADDANSPELMKIAALNHIQLLLVPFDIQAPNEIDNALLFSAEKHKYCLIAATREKSFTAEKALGEQEKSKKYSGFIVSISSDFYTDNNKQSDRNNNNSLIVKKQFGKITKALIHPSATGNNNNG